MKKYHYSNHHIYKIAKEVIEADYIFSIPKLKTHMKAGITAGMKNFVGVVGNKECLPHHMKGSKYGGGDCYGDFSYLKKLAEWITDRANSNMFDDNVRYWNIKKWARLILKIRWLFGADDDISGSWYGNDTIWRTVIDINRIIYYGALDGTIKDKPQREIFSLVDAIIAGENNGPMSPTPFYTGKILFGNSTGSVDCVAATVLGFDPEKIKMLNWESMERAPSITSTEKVNVLFKNKEMTLDELDETITICAKPAERWVGYIERDRFINEKFSYTKKQFKASKDFYKRFKVILKKIQER